MTNNTPDFPDVGTRRHHRMFGPGIICKTGALYQTARMAMFKPDKVDNTAFASIVLVDLEALKEVE